MFAALAITRYLTSTTGVSIKKLVRTLRPLQTVTITIGSHELAAQAPLTPAAKKILKALHRGD